MRVSDEMSFRPACGPVQRAQGLHTSCRQVLRTQVLLMISSGFPAVREAGTQFEGLAPRCASRIGPWTQGRWGPGKAQPSPPADGGTSHEKARTGLAGKTVDLRHQLCLGTCAVASGGNGLLTGVR